MRGLHRVRVALGASPKSTVSVTDAGHAIHNGMGKDLVLYAAPVPSLVVLAAQIVKVEVAEQLALTRAKGAAPARNVERALLFGMLETECAYVQTLCDAAPGPEQAISIVTGAGMSVARVPLHTDPILGVQLGTPSGSVDLDANAAELVGRTGKKAFFNWQFTTDGGKSFNNVPSTPHAKTEIGGLTPLTMVGFRVNVTTTKGTTEWSQVVSILIQ